FLIPISIICIPAFISIFFGISTLITKFFLSQKKIITSVIIFSLVFSIIEYIRGIILSGFPWNLIAYSFSNQTEFIQVNSLVGIYGFNLLCITLFTAPAILIIHKSKKNIYFMGIIGIFIISNQIYGYISLNNLSIKNNENKINIVTISTKVPLERFYSPNVDEYSIIQNLVNLSDPKRYFGKKTIFIWPEGVLPSTNMNNIHSYKEIFSKNFDKNHFILLGLNRNDFLKGKTDYYNSIAVIDNQSNVIDYYDKRKLVPFGEFLPLENVLSLIGLKSLTNSYQPYTKGKNKNRILNIKDINLKLLPTICYEIIYAGALNNNLDYDFIINISEDGWFGNSIGPYQHYAHSKFRSIEQGKTLIRSANNGISAIIDPNGKIKSLIDLEETGSIFTNEIKHKVTLFAKFGNKMYFGLIFIYIFLLLSIRRL
ncbi:apolipoprotein N-acyltransferase, partial [Candidatus Pelagibacter sp.]|nr:apolipoprotein N-acyltransferase [Candidatus Pelagibacter sp.]